MNDPALHGFDEFYGYVSMVHAHNFYPEFMIHNGKRIPLRNEFIDEFKGTEKGIEGQRVILI